MKVLWISNIAFGPLCELIGQKKSGSGGWLDAAFKAIEKEKDLELTIITVSRVNSVRKKKEGNHNFYILPGGYPGEYNCNSLKNKKIWEKVKVECTPDLIQIWGTEYTHGYLALKVMKGIPSVIYMQGVLSQIARHYLSSISFKDLIRSITIRDILKFDWIERQQAKFSKGAIFEAKMLQMSGNVIVENEWCAAQCKAVASNCKIHKSKLSIKDDFYKQEWNINKMKPHSIMSNAPGLPIKGLHILLKAIKLVLIKYPDTKLLIPGEKSPFESTFLEKLRIKGYTKYLMHTIEKLQLKNNIHFLGKLTSSQMAEQMADSNVFVMPSSIENHSSTLIEAMIVGTPCISSYVGGIPEYLLHNINGLIYRFEDYEVLAMHIIKIFDDITFAASIASQGRTMIRSSRNSINLKEELIGIYHKILNI